MIFFLNIVEFKGLCLNRQNKSDAYQKYYRYTGMGDRLEHFFPLQLMEPFAPTIFSCQWVVQCHHTSRMHHASVRNQLRILLNAVHQRINSSVEYYQYFYTSR